MKLLNNWRRGKWTACIRIATSVLPCLLLGLLVSGQSANGGAAQATEALVIIVHKATVKVIRVDGRAPADKNHPFQITAAAIK
jgi:hypothetical protein